MSNYRALQRTYNAILLECSELQDIASAIAKRRDALQSELYQLRDTLAELAYTEGATPFRVGEYVTVSAEYCTSSDIYGILPSVVYRVSSIDANLTMAEIGTDDAPNRFYVETRHLTPCIYDKPATLRQYIEHLLQPPHPDFENGIKSELAIRFCALTAHNKEALTVLRDLAIENKQDVMAMSECVHWITDGSHDTEAVRAMLRSVLEGSPSIVLRYSAAMSFADVVNESDLPYLERQAIKEESVHVLHAFTNVIKWLKKKASLQDVT